VILVTVGTQLAFDRLIKTVDVWAENHRGEKIVAQIGPSRYVPQNMEYHDFVPPDEAQALFQRAELIISHAGMGSILTSLTHHKPILILPRRMALGEHRNDHQMATAKWLENRPGITVAWETADVAPLLDLRTRLCGGKGIPEYASAELISRLRTFIHS
jgi:UDP-N-acetylglucosamine transferase subunit ALG13